MARHTEEIKFVAVLKKLIPQGRRGGKVINMQRAKFEKALRGMGYANEAICAIVCDCFDMAELELECE